MTSLEFWTLIVTIIAALGTGSWIATIIQHLFEIKRLSTERRSELKKEIWFKKVEAWGRVCVLITGMVSEINQWIALAQGGHPRDEIKRDMDKSIEDTSGLETWFSSNQLRMNWAEMNAIHMEIFRIYNDHAGNISQEKYQELLTNKEKFHKVIELIKAEITTELEKEKDKII